MASYPLPWRLYLPKEWAKRQPPPHQDLIPHRALNLLDSLADWGMAPPAEVADAAYGTNAHLRAASQGEDSPMSCPSGRT